MAASLTTAPEKIGIFIIIYWASQLRILSSYTSLFRSSLFYDSKPSDDDPLSKDRNRDHGGFSHHCSRKNWIGNAYILTFDTSELRILYVAVKIESIL